MNYSADTSLPLSSLQELIGTISLLVLLSAPSFGHSSASRSAEKYHRPITLAGVCRIWWAGTAVC